MLSGNSTSGDSFDYMHARCYSPLNARFLSPDPIGGDPASPQSWNRYAYVLDDPIGSTDPTGLRQSQATKDAADECPPGGCDITVVAQSDMVEDALRQFANFLIAARRWRYSAAAMRNPLTGMTFGEHLQVSKAGVAGFVHGAAGDIPFCDVCTEFTDSHLTNGLYDENMPAMRAAQFAGAVTGDVAFSVIGGQTIRIFSLGKNGRLFAQGTGYFNKAFGNKLRIGWGGKAGRSDQFFRIVVGAKELLFHISATSTSGKREWTR